MGELIGYNFKTSLRTRIVPTEIPPNSVPSEQLCYEMSLSTIAFAVVAEGGSGHVSNDGKCNS